MGIAHVVNETASTLVKVAIGAAVGAAAAAVVPLGIPVLTGAVFCGTAVLVGQVTDSIFRALGLEGKHGLSHAISRVVTVLIATGIAAGVATLIGFPISWMGGLAVVGVIAVAELIAWLACKIVAGIGDTIIDACDRHRFHKHHPQV